MNNLWEKKPQTGSAYTQTQTLTHTVTQHCLCGDGRLTNHDDSSAGEYLSRLRRCRMISRECVASKRDRCQQLAVTRMQTESVLYINIYGSIPWWGHWDFFHCSYFNEIGPFLIDTRDRGAGAISTLVWHPRHSEYDGEAEVRIG